MSDKINDYLNEVGISGERSEQQLLSKAIEYVYYYMRDNKGKCDICWSEVWEDVGAATHYAPRYVQRAICNALKRAFTEKHNSKLESLLDVMGEHLNPKTGRVKPSVFITTAAKYLLTEGGESNGS